jgi:hypothetical protein
MNSTFERPREETIDGEHVREPATGFLHDQENVKEVYSLRDTRDKDNKGTRLIKDVLPTRIELPSNYNRY